MSAGLSSSRVASCQVETVGEEDQWPITYKHRINSCLKPYFIDKSTRLLRHLKYQFNKNMNIISCSENPHTFICNFFLASTGHCVLIDSKGLRCPGQEAVPPQESDLKSAPALERLEVSGSQESSWGLDAMCDQEEGEQLRRGPGVPHCHLPLQVTLRTHLALRSLSDYNQGLVILDQIRLFWRDLNAAPDCSTCRTVGGCSESRMVMARCYHPGAPDISTRDTEALVTCHPPWQWHNPGHTCVHVSHCTHRTLPWFPINNNLLIT